MHSAVYINLEIEEGKETEETGFATREQTEKWLEANESGYWGHFWTEFSRWRKRKSLEARKNDFAGRT